MLFWWIQILSAWEKNKPRLPSPFPFHFLFLGETASTQRDYWTVEGPPALWREHDNEVYRREDYTIPALPLV